MTTLPLMIVGAPSSSSALRPIMYTPAIPWIDVKQSCGPDGDNVDNRGY